MKKTNKILSIILAILMVISFIPITASATTYSGVCGDNLTWTYDDTTYTLTISGTGAMHDYEYNNRPWESYEDKVKQVNISDGVTRIGAHAFYSFGKVESIAIPESVTVIGNDSFNGCEKLTNIALPDSITLIDEWTFAYCESLTSITIPNKVTVIGDYAFSSCENLETITIPKGVKTIGNRVFYCCYSLKEIAFPDGLLSIGSEVFVGCERFTSVKIPASVTTIGELAFSSCENLTTIMVDSENQYYSTDEYNSVLFNKDKTALIIYLGKNPQTIYSIPDTVTTICDSAFACCENLINITIGKNVEIIGNRTFVSCFNLTNLIIPDNVKTIGDYAFYNCFNLTSVKIGNGVTSIGNNAFSFNDYFYPDEELQLKELILGNSVTIIGEYAFCNCKLLTSLTIPVSIKTIEWGAFSGCINIEDVYYSGSSEQWKAITIDKQNQPLLDATIHYNYHIHDYNPVLTPPSCTEQGYTTYTCECGDTYVDDYVNALGHTLTNAIEENYIAPTCTSNGSKDVVIYCSVCDEEISRETVVIESSGHIEETIPAVTPTCTETGLTEGSKCSVCGEKLTEQKTVDALGHTPANAVEENYVAPSCTENGSKDIVIYCSVCEDEISRETVVINATGHADNDGDGYCDADNELLDPTVECNHNCHKSGITGFIWKIINFFNKLFGLNKLCECGVAHY